MGQIRSFFYRFMQGRYGIDELYRFHFVIYIAIMIAGIFTRGIPSLVLMILGTALVIYMFFRCFSRNVYRRRRENGLYLALRGKIFSFFRHRRQEFRERKTHVYKKCRSCRARLRLPRVKGRHTVRCPKCVNTFEIRI